MIRSFFLCSFVIIYSLKLLGSAPAEQIQKIPNLKVKWGKELRPLKLGFRGRASKKTEGNTSVELSRVKYPHQKLELVVLLKDPNKAPLILEVSDKVSEVSLRPQQFKDVDPQSLWLVGETPVSRCRSQVSFHLRFLEKKSLYKNFAGLFAVELKKHELPSNPSFYLRNQLTVDTPGEVKSQAFLPASQREELKCQRHLGSECFFVFLLKPQSFGKKHRIHFKGHRNSNFTAGQCPV